MTDERTIARTILDAQAMRTESYNETTDRYARTLEGCLVIAGRRNGLSPNLWYLLTLAMVWWEDGYDAKAWAKDILAEGVLRIGIPDGSDEATL